MEKRKILFLYHIKEREYLICKIIKNEILKLNENNQVCIVNFEKHYSVAFTFKPDIIITFPPRGEWVAGILTMLKLSFDPVIISMTTEGLHTYDPSVIKIMVGHNSYSNKLVDYYIFWGRETAKFLGKEIESGDKITSLNRIKVFGYVMYEIEVIQKFYSSFKIIKKLEKLKIKHKKIIMWATGFMEADEGIETLKMCGCFEHKQGVLYQKEKEYAQTKISSAIKYREKYLRHIKRSAEDNKDILFIVKLHPNEVNDMLQSRNNTYRKIEGISNVLIIKQAIPIGIFFPYVDKFIHYGSTTGVEAYIYKVPTIQIITNPESYPHTEYGKIFFPATKLVDIDSPSEVQSAVKEKLVFREIEEMDTFIYDRFNYKHGNEYHPSIRMAEFLCGSMEKQSITKKDKYIKHILEDNLGFQVRKILYIKLIKDLMKLNIKEFFGDIKMLDNLFLNKQMIFSDLYLMASNLLKVF